MLTNSRSDKNRSLVRCVGRLRRHWPGPEASPLHASENITGRDNRRIHLHSREILALVFSSIMLLSFPLLSPIILSIFLARVAAIFTIDFSTYQLFQRVESERSRTKINDILRTGERRAPVSVLVSQSPKISGAVEDLATSRISPMLSSVGHAAKL